MKKASLTLEDGSVFIGTSVGVQEIVCGELVFNTSMTGYQEMLTDCSYSEQLLVLTYPQIGNVGVNHDDMESTRIWAKGLIIQELSSITSNWRAEQSLRSFLKKNKIVVITNLDTRGLTHKLRRDGSMIGCISTGKTSKEKVLSIIKNFKNTNANGLNKIHNKTNYDYLQHNKMRNNSSLYHIVVYDFGLKYSIIRSLEKLGCRVTIISETMNANNLMKLKPEGILLSNGPGDPKTYIKAINVIRNLINTNIPMLGICLGHQLLALASGASTLKMHYGHHGTNHPVQELKTGKVLITSQNHNFVVNETTLSKDWIITHRSLFDGSVQGFRHIDKPIYGFQGHPEAAPGPQEGRTIFETFINKVKDRRLLCLDVLT